MSPSTVIGGILVLIGLASFATLAWAARKLALLERAVETGDIVVLGVFAAFGLFCLALGWRIFRTQEPAPSIPEAAPRRWRVTVSNLVATAGVLLLMLSVFVPAHWHPVMMLFGGLALLAVSHVLTPCEERLAKLRRARESVERLQ
jgi:hypothetical protein